MAAATFDRMSSLLVTLVFALKSPPCVSKCLLKPLALVPPFQYRSFLQDERSTLQYFVLVSGNPTKATSAASCRKTSQT